MIRPVQGARIGHVAVKLVRFRGYCSDRGPGFNARGPQGLHGGRPVSRQAYGSPQTGAEVQLFVFGWRCPDRMDDSLGYPEHVGKELKEGREPSTEPGESGLCAGGPVDHLYGLVQGQLPKPDQVSSELVGSLREDRALRIHLDREAIMCVRAVVETSNKMFTIHK